jgi:hypothetical protein
MSLVGHVAHIGEMRNTYTILVANVKERDHLGNQGVDTGLITVKEMVIELGTCDNVIWIQLAQGSVQ